MDAINEAAATCGWQMKSAADAVRKRSPDGATGDAPSYTGTDYEVADTVSADKIIAVQSSCNFSLTLSCYLMYQCRSAHKL